MAGRQGKREGEGGGGQNFESVIVRVLRRWMGDLIYVTGSRYIGADSVCKQTSVHAARANATARRSSLMTLTLHDANVFPDQMTVRLLD